MISRLLSFALVFALPWVASAQVTAHQVKMSFKALSQMTDNNEQLKPDKVSANWKDVFELCRGTAPAKDEGIFLFLDCEDINNNLIAIMDTDPVTLLDEIGSIDFDMTRFVQSTKNGEIQSASVPASIEINCGAVSTELFGIMDIKYKALDTQQCPNSGSVKVTGLESEPDTGIIDNGSSLSAEKRTAAFNNDFPAPP